MASYQLSKKKIKQKMIIFCVGGWPSAPDGPYAWGYCFITENNKETYCTPSIDWPCTPSKQYYGRGPIQLTQ